MSEQKQNSLGVSGRLQILQAAGLVGTAVFVSRILGLVREILTRNYLGVTTPAAQAYATAARFPEAIFLIVAGGAIGSAFIPTFAAYFERDDQTGGWRLFAAVINLVTVVVTLLAVVSMLFAEPLVLFFQGEVIATQPEILPLTVRLMRIMLLSPIIFGASGVIMGTLNARQHFLLPALAPIVYNLGIILGVLFWSPAEEGLAFGSVLGACGHLLIQLPGLRAQGARYTAVFTLRDPGVRQVLKLMAPRVLGLSFSEINKFITLFLTGSFPALDTALRLIIMPQGVLGQAMGIATFPTLATLAARQAYDEMRQILSDALRLLLFLGMPATLIFIVLGEPLVTILFERGVFDAEDTFLVATALSFYAIGLVALTALEVIARTFYALSDTLTPVIAGGVQVVCMALLSLWLRDQIFPALGLLPLGGLALGFSLSNVLEVLLLLWLLRGRLGGVNGRYLLQISWRIGLAGAAMIVVMAVARNQIVGVWGQVIVGIVGGGIAYLAICWLFAVPEVVRIYRYGRSRFGR